MFADFGKCYKHLIWGFCLIRTTRGTFDWDWALISHVCLLLFPLSWNTLQVEESERRALHLGCHRPQIVLEIPGSEDTFSDYPVYQGPAKELKVTVRLSVGEI